MWTLQILITTWKLITLDKLLSWAGVLGAQQLYLPAPHGKQQGSICHDEQVAYRPLISGSLPIISCAIMMSLFCCKDTKNIVSRKIMIGRIVFISRGNVRKNNGFPRLRILCCFFLKCLFGSIKMCTFVQSIG